MIFDPNPYEREFPARVGARRAAAYLKAHRLARLAERAGFLGDPMPDECARILANPECSDGPRRLLEDRYAEGKALAARPPGVAHPDFFMARLSVTPLWP